MWTQLDRVYRTNGVFRADASKIRSRIPAQTHWLVWLAGSYIFWPIFSFLFVFEYPSTDPPIHLDTAEINTSDSIALACRTAIPLAEQIEIS